MLLSGHHEACPGLIFLLGWHGMETPSDCKSLILLSLSGWHGSSLWYKPVPGQHRSLTWLQVIAWCGAEASAGSNDGAQGTGLYG